MPGPCCPVLRRNRPLLLRLLLHLNRLLWTLVGADAAALAEAHVNLRLHLRLPGDGRLGANGGAEAAGEALRLVDLRHEYTPVADVLAPPPGRVHEGESLYHTLILAHSVFTSTVSYPILTASLLEVASLAGNLFSIAL